MHDDLGTEALEERHQVAANLNPEKARIEVGRVAGDLDFTARHVKLDVRSSRADEGPNSVFFLGRKNRELGGTGATKNTHEHGLRPVVGVVRGGDEVVGRLAKGLP